ncbi:uncharacterized protein LOC116657929 isoform X1 [Camelus ferus]|uniref:Uncharacterized protein LOC116657929 isoform X1 n=1 Tax=Camelus ferus TaxID=419612 RepID=A0A8B8RK78_CAMFR|nr:uncharacterized protein LOC116657929 isoform X1 [Camelus ferus]
MVSCSCPRSWRCLLLGAAAWPQASASGDEFWPGQSVADILSGAASHRRYLLCDVNSPKGLSLHRDVGIHIAFLLKTLLKMEESLLVLPPWGRLYHWQGPDIHQLCKCWPPALMSPMFWAPGTTSANLSGARTYRIKHAGTHLNLWCATESAQTPASPPHTYGTPWPVPHGWLQEQRFLQKEVCSNQPYHLPCFFI